MEIKDFAAALRAMAENADVLAERHDVAKMAQLQRDAAEHAVKVSRDADLIDELRRQVQAMGCSLDAIGRLRRNVHTEPADAAQVLADALLVIGHRCSTYRAPAECRTEPSMTRGAPYGADAWCAQCVARDALERVDALGVEDQT